MFCGAVQEVCLKISFYLPCSIIGAEFLSSCEGKKYAEYFRVLPFAKPAYLIFPFRSLHSFLNWATSIFLWPESCHTVLDLGDRANTVIFKLHKHKQLHLYEFIPWHKFWF